MAVPHSAVSEPLGAFMPVMWDFGEGRGVPRPSHHPEQQGEQRLSDRQVAHAGGHRPEHNRQRCHQGVAQAQLVHHVVTSATG